MDQAGSSLPFRRVEGRALRQAQDAGINHGGLDIPSTSSGHALWPNNSCAEVVRALFDSPFLRGKRSAILFQIDCTSPVI